MIDVFLLISIISVSLISCLPNSGIVDFSLNKNAGFKIVPRSLINQSQIFIEISCNSDGNSSIDINWFILKSSCYRIDDIVEYRSSLLTKIKPEDSFNLRFTDDNAQIVNKSSQVTKCINPVLLDLQSSSHKDLPPLPFKNSSRHMTTIRDYPIYITKENAVYYFVIQIQSDADFEATVHFETISPYGYLSAIDWPFLPFYQVMCLVYLAYGIAWLTVSFVQFKELLRIQFWIAAVIFLGMFEKAIFYTEYYSINSTGKSVKGMILFAELVSCAKRSLSRMLVIIVSLGFGIVKPRLGSSLHQIVTVGVVYFLLASMESYLRIFKANVDQALISAIPLAFLDSMICWWIFSSLLQTVRVLKLRRNIVKLMLYRDFSITLLFAVIGSVVFMLYSIREHKLVNCVTDWDNLWLDDAFWHVLFSIILLVIMILWRPTRNNQRYAFTPLLDNPEDAFYDGDDADDEEVDQFVNDAFDVKIRILSSHPRPEPVNPEMQIDEELKRIKENTNLSSIIDKALPIFDSDDEESSKFEVSKMQ